MMEARYNKLAYKSQEETADNNVGEIMTELQDEAISTRESEEWGRVASHRGQSRDQSPYDGHKRKIQPRGWNRVHDQIRRHLHLGSGQRQWRDWTVGGMRTKIYPANRMDNEVAYCVSLRPRSSWRPLRRALAKLLRYDEISAMCPRRRNASNTDVLDMKQLMNGSEQHRGAANNSQGSSR
jgi:hypothetical protein